MPNKPAPLTAEEVNKAKLRCDEATPGRWWQDDYSMFVFAGKVPMKICDIRGWGYLTGVLKLTETQAELQQAANCDFIMHAREDLPRALATIEQQREQIAALTRLVDGTANIEEIAAHQDVKPLASVTQLEGMWPGAIYERPPSLAAKIAALEKERDGLAQNNLDCREVLVTLFINEGNTEEIARLSVQEVLGEASCQK